MFFYDVFLSRLKESLRTQDNTLSEDCKSKTYKSQIRSLSFKNRKCTSPVCDAKIFQTLVL